MGAKKADKKAARQTLHQGLSYVVCPPPDESQPKMKESKENVLLKKLTNYFRYILLSSSCC